MIRGMQLWVAMLAFTALALPFQAGAVSIPSIPNVYLAIPGIPGAGSETGYTSLIPLSQIGYVNNTLVITKAADISTLQLNLALVNGTVFPTAHWYEFDTSTVPHTLTTDALFSTLMVSGYSPTGGNGALPLERWSFTYQDLTVTHPSAVPLPADIWLLGSGLLGLVGGARRKNLFGKLTGRSIVAA